MFAKDQYQLLDFGDGRFAQLEHGVHDLPLAAAEVMRLSLFPHATSLPRQVLKFYHLRIYCHLGAVSSKKSGVSSLLAVVIDPRVQ